MVVNRDETLYAHAAGLLSVAKAVPMREDALFRIHSMTKPLTSVAALMLIDEGLLRLDDSVASFVPSFTAPQVVTKVNPDGTPATRPARLPVTIRHLLTHTSGIGYGFSDPMLLQLTTKTGKPEVELPLLHDPGARWTYGASTRVLGEIIERVSSEPLDRFLDARILKPLGMTDTFYRVPDSKLTRVMSRHQRTDGRLVEEQVAAVEESPVRGDGGLYSTARDYGLFLQFLLNDGRTKSGTRLLSQRSMNALRTNQIGSLFSKKEVASLGGNLKSMITPLFIFMCVCMTLTAISEFGPTQWAQLVLAKSGAEPMVILALITGLMAVGRYFGGEFVHKFDQTGVLLASAVLTTIGIFLFSTQTGAMAYVAAIFFAMGVCYFWPNMIGFTAEKIPLSGALGMSVVGGFGMVSTAIWQPIIGGWIDSAKEKSAASGLTGDQLELAAGQATFKQ